MHKLIHIIDQLSVRDSGVGPSRFVRMSPDRPGPAETSDRDRQFASDTAAGTMDFLVDIHAQRLHARSISDLLDASPDKDDEQEKKSCPAGGCPDDTKLNKDIYNDLMNQVAEKKNLNLQDDHQRRVAHFTVLPMFRQQFRENRKYVSQDKEGPPSAEGPEFVIKDGGIYYEKFGKSLQQMYRDQKRLRPDHYDPREHATMTLMEAAFIQGATRVSHISHNKDAKGTDAIRDQITMVLDPVTGKGRMEIQNISQNGHFLSIKEAYDVMKKNHDGFIDGHPAEGVFVFSDAPIPVKRVHEILSESRTPQANAGARKGEQVQPDVHETPGYVRAVPDDTETGKRKRIPEFLQKLSGQQPEEKKHTASDSQAVVRLFDVLTNTEKSSALRVLTEPPEITKDQLATKGDGSREWRRLAEKVLNISEEQSQKLLVELTHMSRIMQSSRDLVLLSLRAGAGVGGALVVLDGMVQVHGSPVGEKKTPVTDVSDSSTAGELKNKHEIRFTPGQDTASDYSIPDKKQGNEYTNKPEIKDAIIINASGHTDTIISGWLAELKAKVDRQTPEDTIKIITEEEKQADGKMRMLLDILREFIREKQQKTVYQLPDGKQKQDQSSADIAEVPEVRLRTVKEYSFMVTLWILLTLASYRDKIGLFKQSVIRQITLPAPGTLDTVRLIHVYEKQKESPSESIGKQEGTQWILLSIIRYLSMIREQGTVTVVKNKKAKKKKADGRKKLHPRGVIFAFSS